MVYAKNLQERKNIERKRRCLLFGDVRMDLKTNSMPDEFKLLCLLHNIGATSSGKSKTIEEIARWSTLQSNSLQETLQKLITAKYILKNFENGVEKYHLTANAIIKVLSLYT
jgi:hypothetical protein